MSRWSIWNPGMSCDMSRLHSRTAGDSFGDHIRWPHPGSTRGCDKNANTFCSRRNRSSPTNEIGSRCVRNTLNRGSFSYTRRCSTSFACPSLHNPNLRCTACPCTWSRISRCSIEALCHGAHHTYGTESSWFCKPTRDTNPFGKLGHNIWENCPCSRCCFGRQYLEKEV